MGALILALLAVILSSICKREESAQFLDLRLQLGTFILLLLDFPCDFSLLC